MKKTIDWRFLFQEKTYVLPLIFLIFLTFVQGLFSAPNTTDAMVYHLVRPLYWLQNGTVNQDFLVSAHDYMPPLSGYILLHLLALGGDRLAFLSQWLAYIAVIVSCFLVAKKLGANEKSSLGISLFVASIPMIVYQATSTQIDLVVTALCVLLLEMLLEYQDTPQWNTALYLGMLFGLGIATKPTFLIWSFGVVLAIALTMIWQKKKIVVSHLITILMVGAFFQIHWMLQNIHFFSTPLGYHASSQGILVFQNEFLSVSTGIVNGIRNIFTEIPVPIVSRYMESALTQTLAVMSIPLNDPRLTWYGSQFHISSVLYPQEDIIASPWHMGLILVSLIPFCMQSSKQTILNRSLYFSTWASFALFSYILKWQPYHNRLLLPFVVLMSIFVSEYWSKGIWWKPFVLTSFMLSALLILVNVSRPFISYAPFEKYIRPYLPNEARIPTSIFFTSREEQYFHARPYWRQPYSQLANSEQLGEASFQLEDGFVYPLWKLLLQKNPQFTFNPKSTKTIVRQDIQLVDADNHCYGDDAHHICLLRAK